MTMFKDNAKNPIIAFDFDGTMTTSNSNYPNVGNLRPYVKEVFQFLMLIDVDVVIWTCRDTGYNACGEVVDDISPIVNMLAQEKVPYTAINKNINPFAYDSRKIYAHMYVDDMAYGWIDSDTVIISVLTMFMYKVLKVHESIGRCSTYASIVCGYITHDKWGYADIRRICHDAVKKWRFDR